MVRRRASPWSSIPATVPSSSTIPVNISRRPFAGLRVMSYVGLAVARVGQDGHVGDVQAQRIGHRGDSQVADRRGAGAEQQRRDVDDDLVDQPGVQERRGQRRSALEEHVLPVAREQVGQRLARVVGAQLDRLGAASSNTRRPGSRSRSPITTRSGWSGEVSVVVVADGQPRVVDGDGVGADQHHVAERAQPVGVAARREPGDPAAGAVGGGAAAVEGGRELPGHERAARARPRRSTPGPAPAPRRRAAPTRPRRPRRAGSRSRRRRPGWRRPRRRPRGVRRPRPGPARRARCDRCGCTAPASRRRWCREQPRRPGPAHRPRRAACRRRGGSPRRPWSRRRPAGRSPRGVRRARAGRRGSPPARGRAHRGLLGCGEPHVAVALRIGALTTPGRRRGTHALRRCLTPPACASHPDFDRRSRNLTWSTGHWR